MDFEKICYGCFSEKENGICGKCGLSEASYQHPILALPLGTILDGRYITGKVLGMGGFGVTYLAFDLRLNVKVAIKEYLPSGVAVRSGDSYTMTAVSKKEEADYKTGADKFLEEARTLAQLRDDPNVVSVQNYFKENNTAYFTMDYIEGKSLKELLRKNGGRIPFEKAKALLLPVMQSLVSVHAKGLLHRDISPDNIFITDAGQSKLLDFGAARSALSDKSMSVVLKHGFAPQEQYASHGKQGPWTDVYAMGATLYHCVTGEMPPDSVDRAFTDTLVPPSKLGVRLSESCEQAILKALALRPEDRFADMSEFIAALLGEQIKNSAAGKAAGTDHGLLGKGITGLLEKIRSGKNLRAIVPIAAAVVALAIILPLALSGGSKEPKDLPALAGETPEAGQPSLSAYNGTIVLPNPALFHDVAMNSADGDGKYRYIYSVGSYDFMNYLAMLQANSAYDFVTEGESRSGESFLFRVIQENAAVDFSMRDEGGEVMITCLGDTAVEWSTPQITSAYLNGSGITYQKWLELGSDYGSGGINYAGTAICNMENGSYLTIQGDEICFTDPDGGNLYRFSLLDGSMTELVSEESYPYALNITGETLFFCMYDPIGSSYNIYRRSLGEDALVTENILYRVNAASPLLMGEWLYYKDRSEFSLCRMKADGTGAEQVIVPGSGGLNSYTVADDCIVYINGEDGNIYRCEPDGGREELIADTTASCLSRYGDWIYYRDEELGLILRYSLLNKETQKITEITGEIDTDNLMMIASDNNIYIANNAQAKIYRVSPGANGLELLFEDAIHPVMAVSSFGNMIGFFDSRYDKLFIYSEAADTVTELTQSLRPGAASNVPVSVDRGNVAGNSVNGGLAAYDDDWDLYYYCDRGDSYKIYGLDPDNGETFAVNSENSWNLNVYDQYVYYTNALDENSIYRAPCDGSGAPEKLNSGESRCVSVVDGFIYYLYRDDHIYRMDLDGSNDTRLCDYKAAQVCVSNGMIFFINLDEDRTPFVMTVLGEDAHAVTAYEGDTAENLCAWGDYVMYVPREGNGGICQVNAITGEGTYYGVELNTALNADNGYIYYYRASYDGDGKNAIYRIKMEESPVEELLVYADDVWNLNVAGDYLYYRINRNGDDQKMYRTLIGSGTAELIG